MELQVHSSSYNNGQTSAAPDPDPNLESTHNAENISNDSQLFFGEDFDSSCSTPFVSAPSSPGRSNHSSSGGFFYSCPASPMHFAITSAAGQGHLSCSYDDDDEEYDFESGSSRSVLQVGKEFEFSARFGSSGSGLAGSMSSADELFLNGQIRPMKLSSHLEKPQVLAPLMDLEEEEEEEEEAEANNNKSKKMVEKGFNGESRGRDLRLRNKSLRRRTRSMSPLRSSLFEEEANEEVMVVKGQLQGKEEEKEEGEEAVIEEEAIMSASSSSTSRSSSAGRNSKRWVFLKEFLYRSKSEGRSNTKFWSNISFSPAKDKKGATGSTIKDKATTSTSNEAAASSFGGENVVNEKVKVGNGTGGKKPVNGLGKKRVPAPSPHELHYKASRAQAEEMRKKTFLPYRQGLLGCLGFSSKGYGAMNGFARALNPVSSR